jgi:hypothetical protein
MNELQDIEHKIMTTKDLFLKEFGLGDQDESVMSSYVDEEEEYQEKPDADDLHLEEIDEQTHSHSANRQLNQYLEYS